MKWLIGSAAVIGTVAFVTSLVFFISVPLPTEVSDSSTKSDGLSEGIQVHGDWVIEVHEPDGTLVEKREFENEFKGAEAIVKVLSRENRPGHYRLMLQRPRGILSMHESTDVAPPGGYGANTLLVSNGGDGKLILQGEFTISEVMANMGNYGEGSGHGIMRVITVLGLCSTSNTLSDCLGSTFPVAQSFQDTALEPPINAEEGQKVIVTVTITIS